MSTIHWFVFFFKQTKRYNYAWYNNVILKQKEKIRKNGLLKLYISFTIKQTKCQIIVTFYSTSY